MRKPLHFTVALAGAAALAACGRPADRRAPVPQTMATTTGETSAAALGPVAAAPDFAARAAASDRFEIDSGKVALARSTNSDVREFASEMIAAHAETGEELRHAIVDAGLHIALPTALPPDGQGRLDTLVKADAAAFDRTYLQSQIDAHQAAIALMDGYARSGDVAQLKRFAADTAPAMREHEGVAREIMATLK